MGLALFLLSWIPLWCFFPIFFTFLKKGEGGGKKRKLCIYVFLPFFSKKLALDSQYVKKGRGEKTNLRSWKDVTSCTRMAWRLWNPSWILEGNPSAPTPPLLLPETRADASAGQPSVWPRARASYGLFVWDLSACFTTAAERGYENLVLKSNLPSPTGLLYILAPLPGICF